MNWIIFVSSFSNTIPDMSVHVGEDVRVSVVSYILTRTHKLDKWIKHQLVSTLGSSNSQKK